MELIKGYLQTSKAMFFWSKRTGTKLHFIQPGKPTQNAFVESFNGKFRDYCLDLNWFAQATLPPYQKRYTACTATVLGRSI